MVKKQSGKTAYYLKTTDLDYNTKSAIYRFVNKKLNKELKRSTLVDFQTLCISVNTDIVNAIYHKFENLREIRENFKTNEDCIKFLEELLWRNEPESPFDEDSKVYKCKDGWYKCKNTGKEFNILTGTLFENTKIPLIYWFEAIYLEQSHRKGIPSTTLADVLGVTQTTAWFMLHKIRKCMKEENYQELKGIVETDEYYEGGSLKNMHYDKKLEVKKNDYQNKKPLQGFVERNGNAVIRAVKDMTESTLNAGILRYVEAGSTLYTDDNPSYEKLPPFYKRGTVVHSKGNYVSKENKNAHTNTIESVWATLSRTLGTYIHVSKKHLQNYANETVFRYNTRELDTNNATIWLLQSIQSTHITWKEIRNAKYRMFNRNQARAA